MASRCKECRSDIPEDARFCPECGTAVAEAPQEKVCTECKTKNIASAKFCTNCGHSFVDASEKTAAATKTDTLSRENLYVLSAVGIIALIITMVYHYIGFVVPMEGKQAVASQQTQQQQEHNHPEPAQTPPPSPEQIAAVEEQLQADPESVELNTRMGNLLFDSGKFDEAIPFYQKSLSKEPENPDVIVDLGVCFFNLQDYSKAQEKFETALNLDKRHVNALYNMGVVAVQLGDIDRLIEYWGILRDVAPNSQQALRATQILEQIHQNMDQFSGKDNPASE